MENKKKRSPVFSIILPTLNRDQLLPRAIKSVLIQTFGNFELIIVDDASMDNTAAVVKQFSDHRILHYAHAKNCGVAAARNSGIRQAKGKYISFLDDDDEYCPEFLHKTFLYMETAPEPAGFSWAGQYLFEDTVNCETLVTKRHWQPSLKEIPDQFELFLKSMHLGTGWGLTVRKDCFDAIGLFDETFTVGEDTELLLRLSEKFNSLPIPEYLVKVHHHPGVHLFHHVLQQAVIYEKILQKHHDLLQKRPSLRTYLYYKIGWWYYYGNNRRKGRKYLTKTLQAEPFNVKKWLIFIYLEIFGSGGISLQRRLSKRILDVYAKIFCPLKRICR